jgi:hypothetical protein
MTRAVVVILSVLAIGASLLVPLGGSAGAQPPTPAPAPAPGEERHPDRVPQPDQALGPGWQRSMDRAVTTAGDESGLHVLVADRRDAYRWRTVATLAEPTLPSDQWIGQLCVTGSGRYAVVVYAPRTFTNVIASMERGAFAAVVDLDSGAVTKLAERVTLAYYNPACGSGETAVVSRLEQSPEPGAPARTWIGRVDAAAGVIEATVRADGQLTSAVPVGGELVAARGFGLVAVAPDGEMTTVAHTDGAPLRLMPEGSSGLALQIARADDVDLARLVDGQVRTVTTVPLGAVKLRPGAGGQVYAIGYRAAERVGVVPSGWRVVNALPDSVPSTDGGMIVTRAETMREAAGRIGQTAPGGGAGTVQVAAQLGSGAELQFTAAITAGAGGRTLSPALAGPDGGQGTAATSTEPWDPDRACAVPRNDPRTQVYQPSPQQVEWAADLAVRGQLTFLRPANWLNNGLPQYAPQGLFPPAPLIGGGDVPAQVLLGILGQESNLWQASWHVVDALAGNPLTSAGFYGLDYEDPDPTRIDWSNHDCGYGAAQVTTGMHKDDTGQVVNGLLMTELRQRAAVLDYATNVAAGLRILQQKWNQLAAAGILANDGDPQYIENWFLAVWAYNSGVQPTEEFGNDSGCTPSPTCTDEHGNWGLGWSNNPASPLYPEDRKMFLTAPLDHPDVDPPDEEGYDNAKHPNHWSYPERVMGWAYTSLRRWNYTVRDWVDTYQTAIEGKAEEAQPDRLAFCVASINQCDPDAPLNPVPKYPATHCQRDDLRCWWHEPVSWESNCFDNCGVEDRRYTTVEPRPLASSIHSSRCNTTGLPAGVRIIDDTNSATPLGPQGCARNWTVGGSFGLEFQSITGPQGDPIYPAKVDFHQIGGGFGGHFWFTHTLQESGNEHLRVTGRWTIDPVNAWARVFVHAPDHGAHTQQAFYRIRLPSGEWKHRAISQHYERHTWVDIGVFDFRGSGSPIIELSNFTQDGVGVHDVAWDAIAVQPLAAKPEHFVVALGDSYDAGEGTFNYYQGTNWYRDDDLQPGSLRNECRRSPQTWSRQATIPGGPASVGELADTFPANLDYHLVACAGAKTHNVLGSTISLPLEQVVWDKFDQAPAGQYGELTQIDMGFLDENTTLVTLHLGGNNAGWTDVLETCIIGSSACHEHPSMDDVEANITGPTPESIALVIEQIQREAPHAMIVLMGYAKLFAELRTCNDLDLMTLSERAFLNQLAAVFAEHTTRNPAVYDPLSTGRSFGIDVTPTDFRPVCSLFVDYPGQGINGVRLGDPPQEWDVGSEGSFHPKVTGYTIYADVLEAHLSSHGYSW